MCNLPCRTTRLTAPRRSTPERSSAGTTLPTRCGASSRCCVHHLEATTRPQPNRCSGARQRSTTWAEAFREATMTGYRIDPNGVETVLNAAKSEAEKFGTILKPLQGRSEERRVEKEC